MKTGRPALVFLGVETDTVEVWANLGKSESVSERLVSVIDVQDTWRKTL